MFRLVANVLGGPRAAGGYGEGHSMPPSDSLVITGASMFMTANKIALFVAFLWLRVKMYLFSKAILSGTTQGSARKYPAV